MLLAPSLSASCAHDMRCHRALALLAYCFILATAPHVARSQELQAQQSKLKALREETQQAETQRDVSAVKQRHAAQELQQLQEEIANRAASIRTLEETQATLERTLAELFKREAAQNAAITHRKSQIGTMVSAAWNLQHRPMLAAWLLPEETRQRALTSRALYVTTQSLREQMQALNRDMKEIEGVRASIVSRQEENRQLRATLEDERRELQSTIDAQQKIMAELARDEQRYARQAEALRRKAANVEQLIAALESQRSEEGARFAYLVPERKPPPPSSGRTPDTIKPSTSSPPRGSGVRFSDARGVLALPAEGKITGRYGDKRGSNDKLKGMEMQTVSGAIVAAPFEGEVLFTGPFLDYGNMVIIRHSQEYHTLLAGLARINVTQGQFLLDRQPIGVMGEESSARRLYIELRQNSRAINPQAWFAIEKTHYATR